MKTSINPSHENQNEDMKVPNSFLDLLNKKDLNDDHYAMISLWVHFIIDDNKHLNALHIISALTDMVYNSFKGISPEKLGDATKRLQEPDYRDHILNLMKRQLS